MTFRFLKFKVYQDSKSFHLDISEILNKLPEEEKYSLIDQLRRASLSIILNIAEGCDKGTDKDFNRFLMNALGSLNEVVAGLDISFDKRYISKDNYIKLIDKAGRLARQIGGFSKKLKKDSR